MKKSLIILFLSCSVLFGQYNPYQSNLIQREWKHKEAVITIAANIACITLDAMGDSFLDSGKKELGHFLNAASVSVLVARPFMSKMDIKSAGWYVSSYILLRMGSFDPIYNATRGLPLGYSGTTSIWDQGWQSVKAPDGWKLAFQSLYFTVGIAIPLNEL